MPYTINMGQPFVGGGGSQIAAGTAAAIDFARVMERNRIALQARALELQEAQMLRDEKWRAAQMLQEERKRVQADREWRERAQLERDSMAQRAQLEREALGARVGLETMQEQGRRAQYGAANELGWAGLEADTARDASRLQMDRARLEEDRRQFGITAGLKGQELAGQGAKYAPAEAKLMEHITGKLSALNGDLDRIEKQSESLGKERDTRLAGAVLPEQKESLGKQYDQRAAELRQRRLELEARRIRYEQMLGNVRARGDRDALGVEVERERVTMRLEQLAPLPWAGQSAAALEWVSGVLGTAEPGSADWDQALLVLARLEQLARQSAAAPR